ncbi:MAG TPA: MATE family efflux transporter [Thermoplasmata archaeon]|nr:MATE family efflux transporter [Thermoplasmata archaeon]
MGLFTGPAGQLRRSILNLAWPVIIANFLEVLAGTIDLVMVGRLGVADIAALGSGVNLIFFSTTVMIGVSSGTIALVARAIGAKNPREAEHFLLQSLVAGVLLSIPVVLVGVFLAPFIAAPFSPTKEILDLTATFVSTIFLAIPSLFIIFLSTAALRAAGDTKTPLLVGVVVNLVNFGINYTLIFGNFGFPALGVHGAAIGTSIAYTTGAAMFLILFVRHRLRIGIRWETPLVNWATIRRILRVGVPAATEQLAFQIGLLAWIVMVVSFGEDALAAQQIGLRIQSFVFMPGLGLSIASSALVGQNLGAKDPGRADLTAREATKLSILIMGLIGVFNFIFAPWIAYAFVGPGPAHDLSVTFIRVHATSIPAIGLFFTLSGSLRGAGDTKWPLYASLAGTYLIRLPLSAALGFGLGLGVFGVWIALPVEYYLRSVIIVQRFNRGAWKAMTV